MKEGTLVCYRQHGHHVVYRMMTNDVLKLSNTIDKQGSGPLVDRMAVLTPTTDPGRALCA